MPREDLVPELWRVLLDQAKGQYDLASAEFRRITAESRVKDMDSPERQQAVWSAIRDEQAARERYAHILREFTERVMREELRDGLSR